MKTESAASARQKNESLVNTGEFKPGTELGNLCANRRRNFVNIVEGGGMTGYEAVTRTCRLMREAFLEEKEMRELVQVKGLGCEVCVR